MEDGRWMMWNGRNRKESWQMELFGRNKLAGSSCLGVNKAKLGESHTQATT
jgi:hypothetical protein